ncbi:MAG: hypothetical protein AB1847_01130 [bacterium]
MYYIYNISLPESLYRTLSSSIIGSCDIQNYVLNMAISGNYACVTVEYTLKVIDISNPASPQLIGSCGTSGDAYGVAISGNIACVAVSYPSGLRVIDISSPASPQLIGSCSIPGDAFGVAISGDHAYVACGDSGLVVIDISDPASPHLIGSCDTSGSALNVAVSSNLTFIACGDSGLAVIDISDPASPHIIGSCDTPGFVYGIAISGDHAYVACRDSGLVVIDISDPASPHVIGSCDTPGEAYRVVISSGLAYVTDGYSGLQVMELLRPLEDISFIDSSTIMATVPAGYRPGTYDLHVTNPDGGYVKLANAFTVKEGPTLIELDRFSAASQRSSGSRCSRVFCQDNAGLGSDCITITWHTLSEIDTAGFNLWRSEGESEPQAVNGPYTRINACIIEAKGGPAIPAGYVFTDTTAMPGLVYSYKLEDIDNTGISTFHRCPDLVEVTGNKAITAAITGNTSIATDHLLSWIEWYQNPLWPPLPLFSLDQSLFPLPYAYNP